MKKIIPGERYEERGNPIGWVWLSIGLLWLAQAVTRTLQGDIGGLWAINWLCAILSFITAALWARYLLIVDENGIETTFGGQRHRKLRWEEIVRIVDRSDSFWKSGGLYVYAADAPEKAIFIGNKKELPPIIEQYCQLTIDKDYT